MFSSSVRELKPEGLAEDNQITLCLSLFIWTDSWLILL